MLEIRVQRKGTRGMGHCYKNTFFKTQFLPNLAKVSTYESAIYWTKVMESLKDRLKKKQFYDDIIKSANYMEKETPFK
jgi:hypothetical protein